MNEYRTIKVRFYGAENTKSELIAEGPLDGNLYWFHTLTAIYPEHEIISYGTLQYNN